MAHLEMRHILILAYLIFSAASPILVTLRERLH